jgi:hypothetical protein
MRQLGVPRNINAPPPVLVARRGHEDREAEVKTAGRLMPPGSTPQPAFVTVPLRPGEIAVMPDLRGSGVRDALRTLAQLGLTARVEGRGVVVEQSPEPGTPLERGLTCTLVLDREPSRSAGASGAQP